MEKHRLIAHIDAFECNEVYHSSKTQVASDNGIDDACGYKAMLHEQTEKAIARMIALGLVAHAKKVAQYYKTPRYAKSSDIAALTPHRPQTSQRS